MCQAKPFPRCSHHARERLARAEATGDEQLIESAQNEFYLTPAGIAGLRKQGHNTEADDFQDERNRIMGRLRINQREPWNDDNPYTTRTANKFINDFKNSGTYDSEVLEYYESSMRKNLLAYGTPVLGRTRAVFYDKETNQVIKIPIQFDGERANYLEALTSEKYERGIPDILPVAKCEMVESQGVEILRMERVKVIEDTNSEQLPSWVGYVDGQQVGYDQRGRIVAYDI